MQTSVYVHSILQNVLINTACRQFINVQIISKSELHQYTARKVIINYTLSNDYLNSFLCVQIYF
jgi:hypothetical protein